MLRFLEKHPSGRYIDAGAHHPYRFSNTAALKTLGWTGVNIDANPESIKLFIEHRPLDINICVGIAQKDGMLKYYRFTESALNTFSTKRVKSLLAEGITPVGVDEIPATNGFKLLLSNFTDDVFFLNIDLEGFDEILLKMLDYSQFYPCFIATEIALSSIEEIVEKIKKHAFLKNYTLVSVAYNTYIFRANNCLTKHSRL